ncbi:RNA polymerase sigma factor [Niabella insulamsoli]|uniref:RNA polymerase sigma factor n=1 Tax=Niabella insulamsoli TaxID=3144874 RepID=UPI0031FD12E2
MRNFLFSPTFTDFSETLNDHQHIDKDHLIYLQNRVAYARDQAAYKKLYLYFHPSIYKLAHVIVQQESLTEEIVSDIMVRIWTMEKKLAFVENLKPYLLTATRNTALTYLKKIRDERAVEIDENFEIPASSGGPDQQLMATEISEIIESGVTALPQKCQLAYRLVKEEGLSYNEAAQVLEISQKTLEAHMSTALKRLRQALDAYLFRKK